MTRHRVGQLLALALFGMLWGADALAWWNGDWGYRKEISFDLTAAGADIGGSPTDVPMLVRLSLGNFQYFGDTKPDGSDLRFIAADDKTPLAFHIERFDPQAQIALIWVRIPRLTGGAKTDKIFLYYGNKNAPGASDAHSTYDVNQALVYHFGAPKGAAQDTTGYKSEPTVFDAEVESGSLIAAGAKFSGAQTIAIPANGAVRLKPDKGITISAWVRIDAPQQGEVYLAQLADQDKELVLGISGSQAFTRYAAGAAPVTITQPNALTANDWHHVAVTLGGGHLTLFVDGTDVAHADAEAKEIGGVLTVGGSASKSNYFSGRMDELQVSGVTRSADWLKAAARSQGMVAPLIVYGGDTQKEGGHESYFATTLRNVTSDGWVVIGILAIMFLASMLIMATKALYLNRVAQGNGRFLEQFYQESADLETLKHRGGEDGAEGFGISNLAQLYHDGMRETLKRLEGQSVGAERARILWRSRSRPSALPWMQA